MKVLVTGGTGFVGSHLLDLYLEKENVELYSIKRRRANIDNVKHIMDKISWHDCDITDAYSVEHTIQKIKPDIIFHLAAQSFVPASWIYPIRTVEVNVLGNLNILEAVRKFVPECIIQVASSSEVYGIPKVLPISEENTIPEPVSPYGVSKLAMDRFAVQYHRSYGIKTVITRAFNHSVSKWTPVIIKNNITELIDIKYISEIRCKQKEGGYLSGTMHNDIQIWDMKRHQTSIWSDNGWQRIKSISCHPIRNNKLLKIVTRNSIFDVTNNHSILDESGNKKNAGNSNIGDKLLCKDLPNVNITDIPLELAWFYGFFVAEGCIVNIGHSISISNNNIKLLDKCEMIIKKYLCHGSRRENYNRKDNYNNTQKLIISKGYKLSKILRDLFYASDRNKKVPQIILNANSNVKLEFLKGFNDGDGLIKGYNSRELFKSFKTKSSILALGLCYLIENTTNQRYTLCVENRNDIYYYAINLNSRMKTNEGKHLRKIGNEIKKIYNMKYYDEVWDFETENSHFHCGIGKGIVHNTGPRRGEEFVCSSFAKQIAEIEKGKKAIIKVGNLDAKRDFTDVRDIANAYSLAIDKCDYGIPYNIASGRIISIKEVLNILLSYSQAKIEIVEDSERLRPSDLHTLQGDATRFIEKTNWKLQYKLEQTLLDLLEYWRKRL